MTARLRSFWFLTVGTATGVASWFALIALFLGIMLVVALPLLPRTAALARLLVAFERRRTSRFLGAAIPEPPPLPDDVAGVLTSPELRRDVRWLLMQATLGTLVGSFALGSPLGVIQNVVVAVFWPSIPDATTTWNIPVASPGGTVVAVLTAAVYAGLGVYAVPPLARWYSRVSAGRLGPPQASMVERLAEVTATRAAALEAHGTELQRIERSLHDGTQNRLVAVVMHLGMVERALHRDPTTALPLVLTAQNAATDALAELRDVVRSIYPPVLLDRGLSGAVAALVAHCAIPCTLAEEPLPRAPAAVEAAAYFVVAEALTNAVKHSGAEQITVGLRGDAGALVVEIADNGHGGADDALGTGLAGIHRRVAAFDGRTEIVSPPGGPTVVRATLPTGA